MVAVIMVIAVIDNIGSEQSFVLCQQGHNIAPGIQEILWAEEQQDHIPLT